MAKTPSIIVESVQEMADAVLRGPCDACKTVRLDVPKRMLQAGSDGAGEILPGVVVVGHRQISCGRGSWGVVRAARADGSYAATFAFPVSDALAADEFNAVEVAFGEPRYWF